MGFRVYDMDCRDVTDEKRWFIESDGTLYYLADGRLIEADDEFWYSPE